MNPDTLKTQLQSIQAADYAPDGVDVAAVTAAMLAHLGTPDAELREELIYITLARWVGTVLGAAEMRPLLTQLLDDAHLFYRMGEKDNDSIFTRSFSLLAIALILYQHRAAPFLSVDEISQPLARVLAYALQEQDLRGHTGDKGWAHTIAHLADVLDEIALCVELDADDLRAILTAIQHTMTTGATLYQHAEDERMAFATRSIFGRGVLSENEWATWFGELSAGLLPRQPWSREGYDQRLNLKQYLRSLYFQALHHGQMETVRPAILAAERIVTLYP